MNSISRLNYSNRYHIKNRVRLLINVSLLLVLSECFTACSDSIKNESSKPISDSIQKVQVKTLLKTTQSWNGSPLPNYNPEHPQMTALRITIPPHTKLPVHRHPVINAGILLKGELTVISEAGDTLHMNTGDPIVEMVNQWHHGENNGDEPAEIVVFYSGNVDVPVTILKETQNADQSAHDQNSQESTAPSH